MKFAAALLLLLCSVTTSHAGSIDGCYKNGKNSLWEVVREYKISSTDESVVFQNMSKESTEEPLVIAAMLGYDDLIKGMLNSSVRVKENGAKALYAAASMGRLSTSSVLITGGISPNAGIDNDLTPIFGAAQYGCVQEMALLVAAGANVNHKAHVNWTLLRLAVGEGNYDAARFLIQNGYIYSANEKKKIKSYLYGLNLSSKYLYIFNGSAPDGAKEGSGSLFPDRTRAELRNVKSGQEKGARFIFSDSIPPF